MSAKTELAWAGRPCDGCEVRRRSTTLCVYRALRGREARGYNLCEDCRKNSKKRARTKPLLLKINERYAQNVDGVNEANKPEADVGPRSLASLCVRMLTLGVLNRVPAMSATRLGPRLDDLGRKQLMQQVLQRVGSKSDDFRQFIQKSGWGPCQLDEDPENDAGEAKQVDQEMSDESIRSAPGGQSSKIEQTPCSQRSLRLVNQRLTLYELEILGYFFETGVVDELDVSWNRLSWKEATEIGNILRLDSCLRLIAAWNSFGPRGARAIGASLSGCAHLRHLNLSANKLGAEGAAALCAGLRENQSVESLDLSFNDLCAAGAQEVSAMLKVNRSIKSINLRSNAMGPPGAFALADALRVNREINEIIVVDNNIGPEGAEAIAGFFQGSIPVLLRGIRGHVKQKAMR